MGKMLTEIPDELHKEIKAYALANSTTIRQGTIDAWRLLLGKNDSNSNGEATAPLPWTVPGHCEHYIEIEGQQRRVPNSSRCNIERLCYNKKHNFFPGLCGWTLGEERAINPEVYDDMRKGVAIDSTTGEAMEIVDNIVVPHAPSFTSSLVSLDAKQPATPASTCSGYNQCLINQVCRLGDPACPFIHKA